MNKQRKVCVVLVDRANYGRLKPVMNAIQSHPKLQLQTLAAGTMVLERFDKPVLILHEDGFQVDGQVWIELEGSTPLTQAKSVGLAVSEFASEFARLEPDVVVIIGDRHEALGAAIAAAYQNITIVHVQGGEVSGSIDESARHAITKLAHYHVPATGRAKEYLLRMGEWEDTILTVGCPSSDIAISMSIRNPPVVQWCGLNIEVDINSVGSGAEIDLNSSYLLVVFHPTTTDWGSSQSNMKELLFAVREVEVQTIILWPNIDAGADGVSKVIRQHMEIVGQYHTRVIKNLPPETYLQVLAGAECAVGNSSSFVRDSGFFGTPVVLVGGRQAGREFASNVIQVGTTGEVIAMAVKAQCLHGRYKTSTLYGDGCVSPHIAEGIAGLGLYSQKILSYLGEASCASVS